MELSKVIIDPEFRDLIPPLSTSELAGLEKSLQANGCIDPLVVWQEQAILLDGHNRYELCRRLGIECQVRAISLPSREEAKVWIIMHQLGRRNLNESQRAMLATELKAVYAQDAAQRQAQGRKAGGHARHGDASLVSNLTGSSHAREKAAAAMNVSAGSVHAAQKVIEHGTSSLKRAVLAGQASVSAAAKVATLPPEEQDRAVAGGRKQIAAAAKKITKASIAATRPEQPQAKDRLTANQLTALADHVRELRRLTDVPSMQYSPINIRRVVAEIVQIVL